MTEITQETQRAVDLTADISVQSANQDVKLKSWILYIRNLNFWLQDSSVERQEVKNTNQRRARRHITI